MFTGLVEAVGVVAAVRRPGGEADVSVDLQALASAVAVGDSIALSGCCCTVTGLERNVAGFHLSEETLRRTWLGDLVVGDRVNLEAAVRAGSPLGGHMVQGHVDGVGEVVQAIDAFTGGEWRLRLPRELTKYCVEKGSIAVDGVSLTIAALEDDVVLAAIIPHTAQVTTLGALAIGQRVNVEVDILAKYVERLLEQRFGG